MRHTMSWGMCIMLASGVGIVQAQQDDYNQLPLPPQHERIPYRVDSGTHDNYGDEIFLAWRTVVDMENTISIRLHFSETSLGEGSFVRVVSTYDNDEMTLDGALMVEWFNSTAYFNGGQLELELWVAPRTVGNRIVLGEVEFARVPDSFPMGGPGECGICGSDDRTASNVDWSFRIMSIGCTGSIWNTSSCFVSAGHCRANGQVAQFRVPASNNNCSTNNPPAADQFPMTFVQSLNGGVGADWAVGTTGTNGQGQRPYDRYGVFMPIATAPANSGQASEIRGYGVDQTCSKSQTQQLSPGSVSGRTATYYTYSNDVRGGNSGSGFIVNNALVGIVTHCTTSGCGNIATRHDNSDFANARNQVCPGDNNPIKCTDIRKFTAKCNDKRDLKGKVILFDTSHNGQTVTVNIDGTIDIVVTIVGDRGTWLRCCQPPGSTHTVTLKVPANCNFSRTVTCP